MSAVPAYSNPIPHLPGISAWPQRVDHSGYLVTGRTRISDSGHDAVFGQRVAVADTTGLNFDSDVAAPRFGDPLVNQLETPASPIYGYLFHDQCSLIVPRSGTSYIWAQNKVFT